MRRVFVMTGGVWLLLIVSLAFNVGFGSTLAVQKVRKSCGSRCDSPVMDRSLCQTRLLDLLDLSPEQADRVAAAQASLLAEMAALRDEVATERSRLGELLTADVADEAAIASQLDRVCAVQRRVQQRVVAHVLAQKECLTPEQRAKFNELTRQHICPCDSAGKGRPCEARHEQGGPCSGPKSP